MGTGKLFAPELKAQLALEALTKHNDAEICERVGITPNMLTRWKHEVEANAPAIFKGVDASEEQIADMERLIGRLVVNQERGVRVTMPPENGKSKD
jgi:hypothetical protein